MTGLDWGALSRLVPEIALVVVFIWFTLKRDTAAAERNQRNHVEWRQFLDEQRESFLAALQDNNGIYREGMARLAEEIKTLNKAQLIMNSLLQTHDQQAREYIHRQEGHSQ